VWKYLHLRPSNGCWQTQGFKILPARLNMLPFFGIFKSLQNTNHDSRLTARKQQNGEKRKKLGCFGA
jgi:hypothetical protein